MCIFVLLKDKVNLIDGGSIIVIQVLREVQCCAMIMMSLVMLANLSMKCGAVQICYKCNGAMDLLPHSLQPH